MLRNIECIVNIMYDVSVVNHSVHYIEGGERMKKFQQHLLEFKKQWQIQLMVIPFLIYILIFMYGPMYGLIIAFQDYRLGVDVMGFSKWVGFKHFTEFFSRPEFFKVMRNTLGINILKLMIGFPAPIIFALMLNEVRSEKYKRTVQTVSYLPHFISWVVAAGIVLEFLSVDGGLANEILMKLGMIEEPIMFMGKEALFWPIVVLANVWKEAGWNAIIYLAAMAAIDVQLYEAAEIDGAGRFTKMWHVTLAGITPTIVILLILQTGRILNQGYEDIMLLTNNLRNTMVSDVSEVIGTYVLRTGLRQMKFSYAAAATVFRSVTSLILLYIANAITRKIGDGENSLW